MATAVELAAMGLIPAGVYGANALIGGEGDRFDEKWERTAANTAGNLAGGLAGYRAFGGGIPGVVAGTVGALGGGWLSDRVSNVFDADMGLRYGQRVLNGEVPAGTITARELLNAHLQTDPIAQQAMYQEKIRQARLMEKEMQRQRMLQYQAQMAQQQGGV
jgi:uncharacterized protein YcfJ